MQLKEKTPASKEDWEKERASFYVSSMPRRRSRTTRSSPTSSGCAPDRSASRGHQFDDPRDPTNKDDCAGADESDSR